jgi:uncharacterized DUF497 family protein
MKLEADDSVVKWLQDFIPDSDHFDWDEGNIRKNLKHGYSFEQIESILWQPEFVFAGRIVEPTHDEWRGLLLGLTEGGKQTALIFTRRGEKFRPISCRPMRENEWRFYEEATQQKGGYASS